MQESSGGDAGGPPRRGERRVADIAMDSETAASLESGAELQAVVLAGTRERTSAELQSALEPARAGVAAYNTRRTRSGMTMMRGRFTPISRMWMLRMVKPVAASWARMLGIRSKTCCPAVAAS